MAGEPIDSEAADRHVRARDLINGMISVLSSRAHTETDPDRRADLIRRSLDEQDRRRRLALDDVATVEQIIRSYPARIRAVRAGTD